MFRECGECTVCCTWLIGDSFAWEFGAGKTCKFLECNGCGVHKARPESCRDYQCAWSQHLLPEEMRPDKCEFLVSVEKNERSQYLKVLPINNKKISNEIKEWFSSWSEKMNTSVLIID